MKTFSRSCVALLGLLVPLTLAAAPAPARSMSAALQPFIDQSLFAGAVTMVVNRDKVVDVTAVGSADLATRSAMRTDSLFWIASMTKPMTVTALMMLVEEGKVSVDDPVEKFLPEFKGQMLLAGKNEHGVVLRKPSHPILVREIISHTSGLPKRCPLDLPKGEALPLRDLVRSYPLSHLETEPGTAYNYSNPGLNTAGRIIEVVSGMPYEQFMSRRLFEPLGMKDTTFFPTQEQLRRLATNYNMRTDRTGLDPVRIGPLTYPLDAPQRHPLPAGGLFSTASDVARFCQMLLAGGVNQDKRYVAEATIKLMTSKQTAASIRNRYGFGWALGLGKDREAYGHAGALRTLMFIDPKENIAGIFLIQRQGAWVTKEEKEVFPAFFQAAYNVAGITVSAANLADPEGAR